MPTSWPRSCASRSPTCKATTAARSICGSRRDRRAARAGDDGGAGGARFSPAAIGCASQLAARSSPWSVPAILPEVSRPPMRWPTICRGLGVLVITSADRLLEDWRGAGAAGAGRGGQRRDRATQRCLSGDAALVTVLDGHPATLAWRSSATGGRSIRSGSTVSVSRATSRFIARIRSMRRRSWIASRSPAPTTRDAPGLMSEPRDAIPSIQSQVAYGHVGNSAADPPLQRLGFDVFA